MVFGGTNKGGRRLRRVEECFSQKALVLDGQAYDLRFLDRTVGGFLGGSNHEIAYAAPLDLGGALYDGERVGRNPGFDARRPGRFLGHHAILSFIGHIVRYFTGHFKGATAEYLV
jgi:hypothetical protein